MGNQKIRYLTVQGSLWYSIEDVCAYWEEMGLLKNTKANITFMIRKLMWQKQKKSHDNYLQSLQIKPFDEFYNWLIFYHIYDIVSKKDVEGIRKSKILQLIDYNSIEGWERHFPELVDVFVECKLSIKEFETVE